MPGLHHINFVCINMFAEDESIPSYPLIFKYLLSVHVIKQTSEKSPKKGT